MVLSLSVQDEKILSFWCCGFSWSNNKVPRPVYSSSCQLWALDGRMIGHVLVIKLIGQK